RAAVSAAHLAEHRQAAARAGAGGGAIDGADVPRLSVAGESSVPRSAGGGQERRGPVRRLHAWASTPDGAGAPLRCYEPVFAGPWLAARVPRPGVARPPARARRRGRVRPVGSVRPQVEAAAPAPRARRGVAMSAALRIDEQALVRRIQERAADRDRA